MAIIYVDSAATGANDGSSWANAYTAFASARAASSAGDFIYMETNHNEDMVGSLQAFPAARHNPVKILNVDKSDDSLVTPDPATMTTPVINFTSGNVTWDGDFSFYGIFLSLTTNNTLVITSGSGCESSFEKCRIKYDASPGSRLELGFNSNLLYTCVRMRHCRLEFAQDSSYTNMTNVGTVLTEFFGCDFIYTGAAEQNIFIARNNRTTYPMVFRGCDLSTVTTSSQTLIRTQTGTYAPPQPIIFDSCQMAPLTKVLQAVPTWPEDFVLFRNCQIGTLTAPPILMAHIDSRGAVGGINSLTSLNLDLSVMTSTYRQGGASDKTTSYCWPMIAAANRTTKGYRGLRSPAMAAWLPGDGTNKTLTVYFAHGGIGAGTAGRLQNDQIWLDVIHGNDAAATSLGVLATTKPLPLSTPVDVADDTSTWVGASVGSRQKLEVTIAPDLEGPVTVYVTFAPGLASDTTVYIDPKPEIS